MKCRHCHSALNLCMADLGVAPPSNSYLTKESLSSVEKYYPLRVLVCENCWLVQTEDYAKREEFFDKNYAYFSSYSSSWLQHCKHYSKMIIDRFGLDSNSLVVEVAANDGYLLQYFETSNIPCLGIEPTSSTAKTARERGIEIIEDFFGRGLGKKLFDSGRGADLIIANNVLAHVPDINDFVAGFCELLKPNGIATFEFPHILNLVEKTQFDTIYHEHYSYLSLHSSKRVLEVNGLTIFDVEEIPTHGGSLRIYVKKTQSLEHKISGKIDKFIEKEENSGILNPFFYTNFERKMLIIKRDFLKFLLTAKDKNETVVAYGAAAKGNTFLNYVGVRSDLIKYVVDQNPSKQGKFLPGSRIPVVDEKVLRAERPAWIVILPWNLKEEIFEQLSYVKEWGAKFVVAIPHLVEY